MTSENDQHLEAIGVGDLSGRIFAIALGGSAVLMLLGSGGLLWWRHGAAIFSEMALAGLAWCF